VVLHTGWHIHTGTGIAYGVILQAVEVATAILLGMPSLLKEGMSWKEVRLRAMNATPVKLPPRPQMPWPVPGAPRLRIAVVPKVAPTTPPPTAEVAAATAGAGVPVVPSATT
jgi:hypothetical protein